MGFLEKVADYLNEAERQVTFGRDWKDKFERVELENAGRLQQQRLNAFEETRRKQAEAAQEALAAGEGMDVPSYLAKLEKEKYDDEVFQRTRRKKRAADEDLAEIDRQRRAKFGEEQEGWAREDRAHALERRGVEEKLQDAERAARTKSYEAGAWYKHTYPPGYGRRGTGGPKGTTLKPTQKDMESAQDAAEDRLFKEFGAEGMASPAARAKATAYAQEELGKIMALRSSGVRQVGGGDATATFMAGLPGGGNGPMPIDAFLQLIPERFRVRAQQAPDGALLNLPDGRRFKKAGTVVIPIPE